VNMHTPELLRQHNDYKAIQARLWGKKRPEIKTAPVVVEEPEPTPLRLEVIEPEVIAPAEAEPDPIEAVEPEAVTVDDQLPAEPKYRSAKAIIEEVLSDFPGVRWADLKGPRRTREFIIPRHLAMYEIYAQKRNMSLPMIGRLFGGRDHTTILSAVRKIERMKMAEEGAAE
jgi:chromosomal replication initiation ATPase DnaA